MKISRNKVVTVSLVVTDEQGMVVGRSDPKEPVEALLGHGDLVPGLEQALDGRQKGDSFSTTLNPAIAYGEFDESLVQTVDKKMFGDFPLEVGSVFEADTSRGRVAVVVKKIDDNEVVIDGNHPLAGKTLNFLVDIVDVRDATAEEIEHGHVHRNGCCPSHESGHGCGCGHHHEEGSSHDCHCGCGHHHEEVSSHDCGCGHGHGHGHGEPQDGGHHCSCSCH